jgi:prolyl oligopeptidase
MTFKATILILISSSLLFTAACSSTPNVDEDPYLWLEEVEGKRAVEWAKDQNQKTNQKLAHSKRFEEMKEFTNENLESSNQIPNINTLGEYYYTLWRTKKNPKGLWKRTKISNRLKKIEEWETVLDIDRLAKKENKPWVLNSYTCLKPKETLCLLALSPGGTDAAVYREFNTRKKRFVKEGFVIPEAKTDVRWIDRHHLLVSSNFGEGSLTDSGYGRLGKVWRRGTPLSKAKTVFELPKDHLGMEFETYYDGNRHYTLAQLHKGFWEKQILSAGKNFQRPINIPSTVQVLTIFSGFLIFELKDNWETESFEYKKGQVLALNTESFGKEIGKQDLKLVYTPKAKASLLDVVALKDSLVFTVLENVKTKLKKISYKDGKFLSTNLKLASSSSVIKMMDASRKENHLLFKAENYLKPSRLYYYDADTKKKSILKSLKGKFKTKGMTLKQYWAKSADGTRVPYFIVGKKSALKKGKAPTILYGYGGFRINLLPRYNSEIGHNWLEQGGLFVLANIRGGGEFGPDWHQAALKENRQKAYDDFIAVAEDLIKRKLTTNNKLGIRGRSNGGLLVSAVMVQRPDLFGAVASIVPLIDMIRYTKLLAGASWISEYGDPSIPKERSYLQKYSPYQNVKKTNDYPAVFFYTSQKDDRVHPGHARKMAHKMQDMGFDDIYYYENQQGGHSTMVNLEEEAHRRALIYEFFHKHLFEEKK